MKSKWCILTAITEQSHALSQWAQTSDLLWFHSSYIPVHLKILSMFILSPYVWWNGVAIALPLAMNLHLKLPVTDLWQKKKRKSGWKDGIRKVNMEERQRSGQPNDQYQSLINPCMSTLTVSHIFNKRLVQENTAQFRIKSIKHSVLVITVSLSNNTTTLTDTPYTI